MPHKANLFTGHFFPDDPRGPLFASGGCTWPSVPGYNLFIGSTTAWGALSFLNTQGIQLKPAPFGISVQGGWWLRNGGEGPHGYAELLKVLLPRNDGFSWRLKFWLGEFGEIQVRKDFSPRSCNQSFLLPEFEVHNSPAGGSGSDCKIMQVEWDATRPPDGWPPE